MRVLKFLVFLLAGSAVVGLYVIAPFVMSLRPVMGGLVPALMMALGVVVFFGGWIVIILRRTSPFRKDSPGLLAMPVLGAGELPVFDSVPSVRLSVPNSIRFGALTKGASEYRPFQGTQPSNVVPREAVAVIADSQPKVSWR